MKRRWCCSPAAPLLLCLAFTLSAPGVAVSLRSRRHSVATDTAARAVVSAESNPLVEFRGDLPRFAEVDVQKHAKSAVQSALEEGRSRLRSLEEALQSRLNGSNAGGKLMFDEVVSPLEELGDGVSRPWGLLEVLKGVREGMALREVTAELEPEVVSFWQQLGQSRVIYEAFVQLKDADAFQGMPEARQRIVSSEVRDRRLSGVGLDGDAAKEFNELSQNSSKLTTDFENHLLDATAAWNLTLQQPDDVRGIPARALEMAAANAQRGGFKNATAERGPWMVNLDATLAGPVLTYAESRELREKLFWAFARRASFGPSDNTPTIDALLENRQRSAELLGYKSFADLSFASKMASHSEARSLLQRLQEAATTPAKAELKELQEFALRVDGLQEVKHWDRSFYVERLRKEKFSYDSESLRSYFALGGVLQGLFGLTGRLFDTSLVEVPAASAAPFVWERGVRLFNVSRGGVLKGYLYLDVYSRPNEKRSGAWVQPIVSRRAARATAAGERASAERLPVAAVICNFPAPPASGTKPSLLSMDEVETLFHEFGHAMQHILTTQNDTAVSGINGIEWDAVEVASQFMEYWFTDDRRTLFSFARHHETGEPLPENIYKSLRESRNFRAASTILGQVYMGSLDLRLHEKFEKGEDVLAISYDLAAQILPEPPLKEDRFLCSFSHIFAGGYAAGYYSYQWSKVLSADAFAAFEEHAGLDNETRLQETGRRFASTFLAQGGGRAPALVFRDFRGRAPSIAALLRFSGLPANSAGSLAAL